MANDPRAALDVKYLLEIDYVSAIYKNGKLIGYYVYITDHIQGAIYQDGAWYDAFLDVNQKVIKIEDDSAK